MIGKELLNKYNVFYLPGDMRNQTVFKKDGKIYYKDEWHIDFTDGKLNGTKEVSEEDAIAWLDRIGNDKELKLSK